MQNIKFGKFLKILISLLIIIGLIALIFPYADDYLYHRKYDLKNCSNEEKAYHWLVNQQRTNRQFVFFNNGLLPSFEGGQDCFTYDQALAAICFTYEGNFKRARMVFDFFDKVRIRQIKKYNKFVGFSDAYKTNGSWGQTWAAGPNAWMLMALNTYMYKTGDRDYQPLAEDLALWLLNLESIEGGIIGGYYGTGEPMTWIATEHNFDCYSAFRDLGIILSNDKYLKTAKNIRFWLENDAWSTKQDRFYMGRKKFNRNYATDLSSWAVLSLGSEYDKTLDFALKYSLCKHYYEPNDVEIEGFDFGSTYLKSPYPDKDAVWFEGTGQMVLAFDRAGMSDKRDYFLGELDKALTRSNRYKYVMGLPYASNEGTPAYSSWLMQDKPICISSTAWYYLARNGINPFSANQKLKNANEAIDNLDYKPDFQFSPVVDDFQYSDIKFLTAYPKELIINNKAAMDRALLQNFDGSGDNVMELYFLPEEEARRPSASVVRLFMIPQDWQPYKALMLKIFSQDDSIRLRIHLKDKQAEPFESILIRPEAGKWQMISLGFDNCFLRSKAASGYGNNLLDRDGIREVAIEIFSLRQNDESKVLIDDIRLK
jgi:hypothetical protein